MQGLQQLISTIKSHTRRTQQSVWRTLSLQSDPSPPCLHCSLSPRRSKHKGPAVRSSSLAREVSRRVLAGLHRLQRLFVCCTLEPFR